MIVGRALLVDRRMPNVAHQLHATDAQRHLGIDARVPLRMHAHGLASASSTASRIALIPQNSRIAASRSEEHTSEPQSTMCIPFSVFCLNKNNRYFSINRLSVHCSFATSLH